MYFSPVVRFYIFTSTSTLSFSLTHIHTSFLSNDVKTFSIRRKQGSRIFLCMWRLYKHVSRGCAKKRIYPSCARKLTRDPRHANVTDPGERAIRVHEEGVRVRSTKRRRDKKKSEKTNAMLFDMNTNTNLYRQTIHD